MNNSDASIQSSSTGQATEQVPEQEPLGKPALFLICALACLVLALSLTMPGDVLQQRQELAAMPLPHLDRAGTLGFCEENGRIFPVMYPDAITPVREHTAVLLPPTQHRDMLFVGMVSMETGVDVHKRTYYRLHPSADHSQHPVFALPREFEGLPVYYQVDIPTDN